MLPRAVDQREDQRAVCMYVCFYFTILCVDIIIRVPEYSDVENPLDTRSPTEARCGAASINDDFCDKIRAYIGECEHCQSIFDCVDGSGVLGTFGGRVRQAGAPLIPPCCCSKTWTHR
jgi:hypothetical protein